DPVHPAGLEGGDQVVHLRGRVEVVGVGTELALAPEVGDERAARGREPLGEAVEHCPVTAPAGQEQEGRLVGAEVVEAWRDLVCRGGHVFSSEYCRMQ